MNATTTMQRMLEACNLGWQKQVRDSNSPQRQPVMEAAPGQQFQLLGGCHNVAQLRELDTRWLYANMLHFFAATERAEPLLRINKHAARFLTGDVWRGAYGAIAMPQIQECVKLLRSDTYSRRAVVSMGDVLTQDINRPACWSFLQFLITNGTVDMLVYQRSLNVWNVMPYDCALLTNIHRHVASETQHMQGTLCWTIGSLHTTEFEDPARFTFQSYQPLYLDPALMRDPAACWSLLEAQ